MSLSTASNRVVATGDGVTTIFYFNRLLYDATHLQVYVAGVLATSGYTVNGVPGTSTYVTFSVAPANGAQVLLLRVVPLTQLSVYAVGGAFPAATTEKNFDLAFCALQQFDEINDRAVTLPVTSTLTATDIPDPALPANYGKGIKIKGDGTGLDTFDMSATPYTSPLTTKGDVAIYSTTADRLPVGTNGQFIVADSTVGRGAKWSGDVPDNVLRVVGSADATKKVAFEVDGITTGTTRTVTVPDADVDLTLVRAATTTASGVAELATTAEVQTGTDTARVPSVDSLRQGLLVSGTPVAAAGQTSIDFTGIPSWAKRITVLYTGWSYNANAIPMVQIGNGSMVTSGYASAAGDYVPTSNHTSSTSGFIQSGATGTIGVAANTIYGMATIMLLGSNTWVFTSCLASVGTANTSTGSGSLALGGTLDRIRVTTLAGTSTFDAGTVNIIWE